MKTYSFVYLLIFCICVIVGCGRRGVVVPDTNVSDMIHETYDVNSETYKIKEPVQRYYDWQVFNELRTVRFGYDSVELDGTARDTLVKNSEFLSKYAEFDILVEGNCDERGTEAYNLCLGQKRGEVVKQYYNYLGIDSSRITVISYGEEKPVEVGHNEESWVENRRVDTKVK